MIDILVLGVGVMVVGVLSVALLEALVRRADLGAALVLAVTVIYAVLIERVPAVTLPGGIRVELYDVAFGLILAAAILRLLRMRRFSAFQRSLVLVGILLFLSLLRGAMAFGIEHSVAEFRLYLAFVSGALYFATFPPSSELNGRIGKIWLVMSVPMMILVCLRWLANFKGIDLGVPAEEFGADAAIKVLNGPYTFFLANAAMLTVPFWLQRGDRARKLTRFGVLLLVFVVLLNRRTVWLTLLAGVVVLVLRNRKLGRRAVVMVVGAALVTVGVYIAVSGTGTTEEPVAQSAAGTETLDWRIEGWQILFRGWSEDWAHWLVGQPFGSGFARKVQDSEVQADPHNFYLTTLLRMGVAGLLALIVLTAGALRALWRIPDRGGGLLAPEVFPPLLAMQLVWFVTWVPGMEQGIITGLAVGLATQGVLRPSGALQANRWSSPAAPDRTPMSRLARRSADHRGSGANRTSPGSLEDAAGW
jgi:O-antigen ligase